MKLTKGEAELESSGRIEMWRPMIATPGVGALSFLSKRKRRRHRSRMRLVVYRGVFRKGHR